MLTDTTIFSLSGHYLAGLKPVMRNYRWRAVSQKQPHSYDGRT
jgi:hypothetical protein